LAEEEAGGLFPLPTYSQIRWDPLDRDNALRAGDGGDMFPIARFVDAMRSEHRRLQALMAEVRLLAGVPVQLASRQVVQHTWALRVLMSTGTDPRAGDFSSQGPRNRVLGALFDFYRTTRRQLQVNDADGLAPMNPGPVAGPVPDARPS
jgi:hypothetical protein